MENELYAEYEKLSDAAVAAIDKCTALRKELTIATMMGRNVSDAALRQAEDETDKLIAAADEAYERYDEERVIYST